MLSVSHSSFQSSVQFLQYFKQNYLRMDRDSLNVTLGALYPLVWVHEPSTSTINDHGARPKRSTQQVSQLLSPLYDAVLLAAHAINLTLARGGEPTNSSEIMIAMQDATVRGLHGMILTDNNAQVKFNFRLLENRVEEDDLVTLLDVYLSNSSVFQWREPNWPGGKVLGPDLCFMEPSCGIQTSGDYTLLGILFGVFVVLLGIAAAAAFFLRKKLTAREMRRGPNKILLTTEDLTFVQARSFSKILKEVKSSSAQLQKPDLIRASEPKSSFSNFSEDMVTVSENARYNGDIVHLKKLAIASFEMKHSLVHYLKSIRDMRHENLNPFVGFFVDPQRPSMIMEYCNRGSLEDILNDDNIKLDWSFKLSLLTDLVRGMRYINTSPVKFHGFLKSGNCVIDSRWVLKVTDYGIPVIYERYRVKLNRIAKELLWTAPEHLRDLTPTPQGSQKGDVFSFAIILQEVIIRGAPYCMLDLTPDEIIRKIKKPPPLCRPSVSQQAAPPQYIQIMKQCWAENPDMRPDFDTIYQQFKDINKGKKMNIVDTMFKMLEKYSNDLEEIVRERTEELAEEKKKTEHLISRMLPGSVARSLLTGRAVEAETYSEVTIYFSDIVGFTTISAMSTPMQVVALLNELYTMFDGIIELYEVYKVETIGDAYMVAAGLPEKNERHAGAISTMALDLLSECGKFTIRHMPDVPMRLRIGLHTGPCVAGVVGLTMPRYCLFGDTVNTASRMESTGLPFRIHISETTKLKLDLEPGFKYVYRGKTELKGKGFHKTYWLVGKEGFTKQLPDPPEVTGDNHGLDMSNIPKAVVNPNDAETTNTEKDIEETSVFDKDESENPGDDIRKETPETVDHTNVILANGSPNMAEEGCQTVIQKDDEG